jgi:hypothetical protein
MARVRTHSLLALLTFVASLLGGLSACGEDLPSFPATPRDLGIECISLDPVPTTDAGRPATDGGPARDAGPAWDGGPAPDGGPITDAGSGIDDGGGAGGGRAALSVGCATGEVCLQGHCYEGCGNDDDCTATEQCKSGVCVVRTTPRADMGPPDLGYIDPCASVTCSDSALPYCDSRAGTCVQCRTSEDCGLARPVCDIAMGVCRTFVPAQCAPCKLDVDCVDGIGTFDTRCLARTAPLERVCVAVCAGDGSCPQGTVCDVASNRCLPRIGSCTTFFAAWQRRDCSADAECAPLGATTSDYLWAGSCLANVCSAPCGTAGSSLECADAALTCDGTFCVP